MLRRADLANLVNEAALLAGRQTKIVVEKIDFIHAVERSIAVKSLSLSLSLGVHIGCCIPLLFLFKSQCLCLYFNVICKLDLALLYIVFIIHLEIIMC